MFKNYLKIAWRNICRNKLHSAINIFGLAVAFSISIVLFLVAYFHLSYDSFHNDKDQLFKASRLENTTEGKELSSNMPLPLAAALQDEIPDIETAITVHMGAPENLTYNDINLERAIVRTNPEFFDILNFPIIQGSATTALSGIQSIALSEGTAEALFGEVDPIGKELKIGKTGEQQSYIVSSIIEDAPRNSSIHFDAVARIESLTGYGSNRNNWGSNASNVFVKVSKKSNQKSVERKMVPFVKKYYQEQLAQLKAEHPEIEETGELLSLNLTSIEDMHFSGQKGAPLTLLYALIGLGAFILLIACFNFVNLNMARSFKRSRELGVRKTLGAFKGQLFLQLWGEAFLLYFFGFVLGLGLAYQLIPMFNAQFGGGIEISTLLQPTFLSIMVGVFVVVTLIAGGYPALKMANFRLVEILKGNVSTKKPGALRNTLLVSQFAISSLLICVSVIAGQQMNFLKEKPIGFEREQVVSIPVGNQENGKRVLERIRNELSRDPSIASVTGAGGNLGRGLDRVTRRSTIGMDYNGNQVSADWLLVDFDYLKTLQIPILKGRDFNRNYTSDTINAIVVTESFVKAMGEVDPVGKFIGGENSTSGNQIIGVVPDFYAYSPSERSRPIAMHISPEEAINYIFIKVSSNDPSATMEKLSIVWDKVASDTGFRASFLNENLQAWYEGEQTMTVIFGIASSIAIFLSCLGLFAISLLVIELRTKEIGIRKVMGASIKGIVKMISFHFLKLVLIGLLIAIPLAWFAMQNWIEGYEYRIDINPLTFIGVGFLVSLVAVLTVSFHSIKAALTNPVKSLRTE